MAVYNGQTLSHLKAENITFGGTAINATAAEINRTCDVSARLVAAGATLTVTTALHDNKTILLDTLAGSVCTLPAASGSGARFKFVVKAKATSNSHKIQVARRRIVGLGVKGKID